MALYIASYSLHLISVWRFTLALLSFSGLGLTNHHLRQQNALPLGSQHSRLHGASTGLERHASIDVWRRTLPVTLLVGPG